MKSRFAVLAAALAVSGIAQAQTKWDMPTPYADGEFHTRNVKAFAEDVKKATGGKLDIMVHANGSLIKHPDILRAVSTGQVNIAEFLLGAVRQRGPGVRGRQRAVRRHRLRQRLEVLPGAEAAAGEEARRAAA